MKSFLISFGLVLSLALSFEAFAYTVPSWPGEAPDYWYLDTKPPGPSDPRGPVSSVNEGCDIHAQELGAYYSNYNYTAETNRVTIEGGRYKCHNRTVNSSGNGVEWHYAYISPRQCQEGDISSQCAPQCDEPNYIDPDSGECLPPEEVCYTNFEDMSDECIYISPDEDPETPEGCVKNESGKQICLGDQPSCYEYQGINFCPNADEVCGIKNDKFQCLAPEAEGCGYFNGEQVCFTPDGEKVEEDSPDHPKNGGNLDGDDGNDPKDPRDPDTEGGNPDDQVAEGDTGLTEETGQKQLKEQKKTNDTLNDIKTGIGELKEEISDTESEDIKDSVQNPMAPGGDLAEAVDAHEASISEGANTIGADMVGGAGNAVKGLVTQGTCNSLGFTLGKSSFHLDCAKTQKIRDLLSWVMYVLTVWTCFNIITEPTVRRT